MTNPIVRADNANFATAVKALIGQSCIIDFGFIQEVRDEGVVDVALSVSGTKQDIVLTTCVLANIASEHFTLDVKPKKGDRVIVFYPRRYDDDMFDFPESEEARTKIIINNKVKGYNLFSGIALLFNQYRDGQHHNRLQIDDKSFNMTMFDNKFTLSADKDGKFSLESSDNKIKTTDTGILIEDKNGCKFETSSEGTLINGKLKIGK